MSESKLNRVLLLAYPRWFRQEFEPDLAQYLAHQRAEPRYRGVAGALRFARHAFVDAITTGMKLRAERFRERWRIPTLRPTPEHPRPFPGNPKQQTTNGDWGDMFDSVRRDVRDAVRALTRNPGYAAVFILTLGLGIGANTAMFSAVNGVLLRPLPHEDGDRLVYLRHTAPQADITNALFSVPEIDDYRQGSPSLAAVAEFSALNFTLLGYDTPRRVRAGIVTGNYFEVMGLHASMGRVIGAEDDGRDAPAVIVLSDAYWRSVLSGDPEIIGKTVEINGRIATFVGIAQPAPPYPERTDIYVNMATSPHHVDAAMTHDRIHRMTEVFARLAPDATVESVRAETSAISARIHDEYPEAYDAGAGFEVTVTELKNQLTSRARPTLLVLLGTAFIVLVIACANLANLTLARVLRRDHELAIRVSLGGSRLVLRRALMIESLVLAVAGAALGLVIAAVGLDLLVTFAARFTSRASEITLDASVFGFAFLAALAATAFFTIVPPLPDGDRAGNSLTSGGSRTTASAGAKRAQRALVVAQIAMSFVLLIGAGLLLRTMQHLNQVDPGFDTAHVLTMGIPANGAGRTSADLRAYYLDILDGVRSLPGVDGAALTSSVPLRGTSGFSTHFEMDVDGHEPAPGAPTPRADFRVVSTGYFDTMGITILRGRAFVSTDLGDSQGVVVINESMARAYFGERNPVGERIAWTDDTFKFLGLGPEWRTVVGVATDTRDGGLDAEVGHVIYNPYHQVTPQFTGSLVVRLGGDAAALMPTVRETILARDSKQPIVNVATLSDLSNESVAPRRLNTMLLGAFAALALVIAAVGIGGVLAFSVGSRRHEFGVRSALGAARRQIWSGVLVEGARLAVAGIALGSLVALFVTRFIAGLLVGVPAVDPVTFVAVGALLAAVAVLAAWIPAWRAAEVSPMEAMGSE